MCSRISFESNDKRTEELYLTRLSKDLIDSFKKLSMFEREVANLLLLDYSPSEIAKNTKR